MPSRICLYEVDPESGTATGSGREEHVLLQTSAAPAGDLSLIKMALSPVDPCRYKQHSLGLRRSLTSGMSIIGRRQTSSGGPTLSASTRSSSGSGTGSGTFTGINNRASTRTNSYMDLHFQKLFDLLTKRLSQVDVTAAGGGSTNSITIK